jgi:hypothetical protein
MSAPVPVRLSKSKFVAGQQCLKRLYLQIYQPELAGETDAEQEAQFEQGHEVGALAQSAFPGGVLVDSGPDDLDAALARTTALMADTSVPAVFEATFRHSNVLVRVDILQRRRRNRWRLIEVKSSVEVKEHYLYDVAIQYHVLQGCGLDLSSACLMHLNREYVYDGVRHDAHELFVIEDLTRRVRRLGDDLPRLLRRQQRALAQEQAPAIDPFCFQLVEGGLLVGMRSQVEEQVTQNLDDRVPVLHAPEKAPHAGEFALNILIPLAFGFRNPS